MWFLACKENKYKLAGFGCLIGIQPLWWYTTYQNEQYGMFALAIIYFFIGIKGFYTHWKLEK